MPKHEALPQEAILLLLKKSSVRKFFTSPPKFTGYCVVSKELISLMPLLPSSRAGQNSSLPIPMEEITPRPVITTRLSGISLFLCSQKFLSHVYGIHQGL